MEHEASKGASKPACSKAEGDVKVKRGERKGKARQREMAA